MQEVYTAFHVLSAYAGGARPNPIPTPTRAGAEWTIVENLAAEATALQAYFDFADGDIDDGVVQNADVLKGYIDEFPDVKAQLAVRCPGLLATLDATMSRYTKEIAPKYAQEATPEQVTRKATRETGNDLGWSL